MADKKHILVVDDSSHSRLLLRTILAKEGFEVTEAGDGEAALDVIESSAPDLILLDLMMPGMSGEDLLVEIRNRSESKNLPVIVVTADKGQMSFVKIRLLGAMGYLTKPINNKTLVEKVNACLEILAVPDGDLSHQREEYVRLILKKHDNLFKPNFLRLVANLVYIRNLTEEKIRLPDCDDVVSMLARVIRAYIKTRRYREYFKYNVSRADDVSPTAIVEEYLSLAREQCDKIFDDSSICDDISSRMKAKSDE